jgi:hypothetical protein
MKAHALLQTLDLYLSKLVEAEAGEFAIHSDPESALESLSGQAPSKWRVAMVWSGYQGINQDSDTDTAQDSTLKLYLQFPESMEAQPTKELFRKSKRNVPAMLERIEKVILWMRMLRIETEEFDNTRGFRFQGSDWEAETKSGHRVQRTHRIDFKGTTMLDQPIMGTLVPLAQV